MDKIDLLFCTMKFTNDTIRQLESFPAIAMEKKVSFVAKHNGTPGVFYIKKGIVKAYKKCKENYFMSWIGFEGDLLGVDSVFSGDYSSNHYETTEEVVLYFIPKDVFLKLFLSNQTFMSEIMHYISEKSDVIEARIANINANNVNLNFIKLLHGFSDRHITKVVPDIVSTNDIANMIGTTKNYVYKMIQKLEDQLIVSFKNRRLQIINKELLHKALQHEK